MGVVYRARQVQLDRVVALKILHPEKAESADLQARFEREAKVLASLQHPHIVQIFDLGRKDRLYYIVMEFVEGTTLRERTRRGIAPPEEAVGIMEQVCRALEYAHAKGVVHRDIKPENILLDKDGQVKVSDFGLAKILGGTASAETLTRSGAVVGTMAYMAPEQWENAPSVDGRADVYSTGAVLYELLTGEIPRGRIENPTPGSSVLGEIVLKALERDPVRRYRSAADLRSELLQSTAPSAATPLAPRATPSRRKRWWALVSLLVVLVAGAGSVWHLSRRGKPKVGAPPPIELPAVPSRSPREILQLGESEGPSGEKWGAGRARPIVHGGSNPLIAQEGNDFHVLARYLTDSCPGLGLFVRSIRWGFVAQWNFLDYVVLDIANAAETEPGLKARWRCDEIWSQRREDMIVLVVRYRGASRKAYEDLIRSAQGKLEMLDRTDNAKE